jgi:hypothetical protein
MPLLFAIASIGVLPIAAASAPDGAVIVDSGSTNSLGYKIEVWSDGRATLAARGNGTQPAAKSFTMSQTAIARFFADLKAARDGKATGVPCMKSASFGTTTRVYWHGWMSPDLDCPAGNALTAALVHDVGEIRAASGIANIPLHRIVFPVRPIQVQTPSPTPAPAATPT